MTRTDSPSFLSEEMGIRPDLPDLSAVARPQFTLEWGVRQSDGSLVIHIFPPIVEGKVSDWDYAYAMDKRLDKAIPEVFDVPYVHAGFEKDYNSFYIIVRSILAPDLRLLIQKFLDQIEAVPQ